MSVAAEAHQQPVNRLVVGRDECRAGIVIARGDSSGQGSIGPSPHDKRSNAKLIYESQSPPGRDQRPVSARAGKLAQAL
jgi:hypothetical protein